MKACVEKRSVLGWNKSKESCCAFKLRGGLHEIFQWHEYVDLIVSSLAHQIKAEYYGGNRSVSN